MSLLPPEVGASSHLIGFYQKYSVFSWPWSLRRTLVFAPLVVVSGLLFGLSHVATVHDWWDGAAVAWRQIVAGVALVAAGPFFAAAIRARRWPNRAERAGVVGAVIAGIVVAAVLDHWADAYHDARMSAHGMEHAKMPGIPGEGALAAAHGVIGLAVSLFLGSVFALFSYFGEERRWREYHARRELERLRLQKHAADQELAVLQAQVEPHFLFNTLASVRSLVFSDAARAARTIDALVDYLRAALPKLRADGIAPSTLAEQFALCESYLALMRVRMGERLQVSVDLPEPLRAAEFPPLILLSLVENAIKHGIEPKPGPARIALRAAIDEVGGLLLVWVEDDGAGLQVGVGSGTGLANIRAHLANRYGGRASLRLEPRAGGGAVASIRIPCA